MSPQIKQFIGKLKAIVMGESRLKENISKEEFRALIANPPSTIKSISFHSNEDGVNELHITYEAGDKAFVKVDSVTQI